MCEVRLESKSVYIVGGTGFIGSHFIDSCEYSYQTLAERFPFSGQLQFNSGSCIVFLAGMAHNKAKNDCDYFQVNTEYPVSLARIAKLSGSSRFVYLSSVNVYDNSSQKKIIDEKSLVLPKTSYAKSKLVAEEQLLNLADDTFDVIILRCPLVYGAKAPANFDKIKRLSEMTPILPFGSANSLRSYLSIGNLCSAINIVIGLPIMKSGVYNLCDDNPLSTKQLTTLIRESHHKITFQIPVPKVIMSVLGRMFGMKKQIDMLFDKMVISNAKFCEVTSWSPQENPEQALYKLRDKK